MTVCVVCPSDCPGVKAARLFEAYCSFRSNIPGIKHPKGAAICLFSSIRPDTNKYKPSRQQRNSRFGGFCSLGDKFSIRREIVEISAPQSANNGQIHPTKDKESRELSRLSSFRRYSVACIITRNGRLSFLYCPPADGLDDLGRFGVEDHGNRLRCGRYLLAVGGHILMVGKMQNPGNDSRIVLST